MKHKIEIAPNLAIVIDGERVIGSKPQGLFLTTEMIVSDEDLKRLADRCFEVISDRKEDTLTHEYCDTCNHIGCEYCIADGNNLYCVPSNYKPKDKPTTQTETQNSKKNSNVISVYDGVSEAVRCAMCNNPNKSDRGCDGACSYDKKLYERIIKAIVESIVDTPQMERESE